MLKSINSRTLTSILFMKHDIVIVKLGYVRRIIGCRIVPAYVVIGHSPKNEIDNNY